MARAVLKRSSMKPKMIRCLALDLAVLISLLLAGCSREFELKAKLLPDEQISEKSPVLLDGTIAGYVKAVRIESGDRVAVLALTDKPLAQQRVKLGTVRVVEDGKISLRTDGADARSPMLANGETVPVMSKTGFAVRHLASNKMLTALLAGLAVVALVLFCFRRLARGWLLLLTLVLSGWIAWVALPWTSDAVAKVYTRLPQAASVTSGGSSQDVGAESVISRLMEKRPSPEAVAYAAVFVATFIVLSAVMRSSLKRLEGQI